MSVYISFLRGINVSGSKPVKMDLLKKIYSELHFKNISTYLQSGNVIFTSKESDKAILADKISQALLRQTGFDITVIVLTKDDLQDIVTRNPYEKQQTSEMITSYITLLNNIPTLEQIENLQTFEKPDEMLSIMNQTVYLNLKKGYGNSKLNNNFIESKLKMPATTRNLKTMQALMEIADRVE